MWKVRICSGYISIASDLPPRMGKQNLPFPWMLALAMWFVLVNGVGAELYTINCVCVCVCVCVWALLPGLWKLLTSIRRRTRTSAYTTEWALWSRPTVWNQFQLTCRPINSYMVSFVLSYRLPFHAALLQQKLIALEGTDGEKRL